VEARFIAADGAVLGREHRTSAALTWLGSYAPDLPVASVAAVELHTRLHVPEDATYLLGAGGLGSFRLTVGNQVVLDTHIELPAGSDPVEGMMRPPQQSVPVELRAGDDTELVLRYEPETAAGGFGDAELGMVMFQLNAARPISEEEELERAVALAAEADVAIVVVGTTEEVESEGFDRDSLALPGAQDELVRRVAAANPRTVVVVNAGAPVLLPWAEQVPAVLLSWFPGQEFGNALADVLLGDAEPGGRLPTTWPATDEGLPSTQPVDGALTYDEGLFIGYRGYDRDGRAPRYPFGHGLGYTSWSYLDIEAGNAVSPGEDTSVQVRVRNTGDRPGREVVQLYLSRPESSVTRPARWLGGFATLDAPAGAETTAQVHIPAQAFAHWDTATSAWTVEPGTYRVQAGSSIENLPLTTEVDVR
jgi:beta-glucosidase